MKINIPDITKQIDKEDVIEVFVNNYRSIGTIWVVHQMEWSNRIYSMFKDHDKAIILIYLIRKTLGFYSRNFIKLSFEEFYGQKSVKVGKFNIIDISKNLSIPKESARRKLIELEKNNIIKSNINKKKDTNIIFDGQSFPNIIPNDSINKISNFLSLFSKLLVDKKILPNVLSSVELKKVIEKNFTYIWKIYYDMQISMMTTYKKVFTDLEVWHIFGTCVVNQHLYSKNIDKTKIDRMEFIKDLYSNDKVLGLNAMSISDITGIPRATVVRKLKKLLKLKFLIINNKKHYKASGNLIKKLLPLQSTVISQLANFSTKVYNLAIL